LFQLSRETSSVILKKKFCSEEDSWIATSLTGAL
jgi:hypothetical protein